MYSYTSASFLDEWNERLAMFYKVLNNLTPVCLKSPLEVHQDYYSLRIDMLLFYLAELISILSIHAFTSWNNIETDLWNEITFPYLIYFCRKSQGDALKGYFKLFYYFFYHRVTGELLYLLEVFHFSRNRLCLTPSQHP